MDHEGCGCGGGGARRALQLRAGFLIDQRLCVPSDGYGGPAEARTFGGRGPLGLQIAAECTLQ